MYEYRVAKVTDEGPDELLAYGAADGDGAESRIAAALRTVADQMDPQKPAMRSFTDIFASAVEKSMKMEEEKQRATLLAEAERRARIQCDLDDLHRRAR